MFGLRFIKTQPTDYVIQFSGGKPRREGAGLSFLYFAPTSALVVVPTASINEPFVFSEVTSDFQEIVIQGQITYRIADPKRTAALLNFAIGAKGHYVSDDPQQLSQRLIGQVQVAMRADLQSLPLKDALVGGEQLVERVTLALKSSPMIAALGIETLGLSILAIKPKPETARALEAEAREALLRQSDEAIYARRNAAVEQERAIKENELGTEIAIENKKRQVTEARLDSERVVREHQRAMEQEDMTGRISLEQRNRELVSLSSANAKEEAEAKAYGISAVMRAFSGSDAKVLQALATVGMDPSQLMALAFRDLAENAGKIGQLNMTPDLLREIMARDAAS
jgi:hypothetical protein